MNNSQKNAAQAAGLTAAEIVAERGSTHGDYGEMSRVQSDLLAAAQQGCRWPALIPEVRVFVLSNIQKLARILTGNSGEPDHYKDIEGYAHLAHKAVVRIQEQARNNELLKQEELGARLERAQKSEPGFTLTVGHPRTGKDRNPDALAVQVDNHLHGTSAGYDPMCQSRLAAAEQHAAQQAATLRHHGCGGLAEELTRDLIPLGEILKDPQYSDAKKGQALDQTITHILDRSIYYISRAVDNAAQRSAGAAQADREAQVRNPGDLTGRIADSLDAVDKAAELRRQVVDLVVEVLSKENRPGGLLKKS